MPILFSKRAYVEYLEHCRIHRDGDNVVFARSHKGQVHRWNIPTLNASVLVLGPGTSITQGAAARLGEDGVLVAFTGGGGTPLFMASQSEYRPTEYLHGWLRFWAIPEARLAVARFLFQERVERIRAWWSKGPLAGIDTDAPLDPFVERAGRAGSIQELMAAEGALAHFAYRAAAREVGLSWHGRTPGDASGDAANRNLDRGNYLAYGLAGAALWALGIPFALPVTHGFSRPGGLVFDIADTFKDAVVLPLAFEAARRRRDGIVFKDDLVARFNDLHALQFAFDVIGRAIAIGGGALPAEAVEDAVAPSP
ncbi:MAG: type I-F CRISPR-associated endonuclease Cas1 [Alphaproteobacteria bacterium]|nr:type I-F CRISPR-associated endonuclease Cas1 [Alphaproteobacteria bacterium]